MSVKPKCPTHEAELFSDGSCPVENCQYLNEELQNRFLEELDELENTNEFEGDLDDQECVDDIDFSDEVD